MEEQLTLATAGAPQVSVIVPFLNGARFLTEAVESVLGQTYPAWELLLIDDGSTDSSADIARQYAAQHPGKVRYLEHTPRANKGVAATRNLGVRHARGQFLAMLDADDVWLPHKLGEQVPLLERHPDVGMLYGNSLYWHSWTGAPQDAGRDYQQPLGVPPDRVLDPMSLLAGYLRGDAAVPVPSSVLARREVVSRVGGFEESFRTVLEDQAFFAKMLTAAPAYVVDRAWDRYRIHPDSACAVTDRKGGLAQARLAYLDWLEDYLRRHGVSHGEVWDALRADKWRSRHPQVSRGLSRLRREIGKTRARARAAVSPPMRQRMHRMLNPLGGVRFGNLRRTRPVSPDFGYERGLPIDRGYIEQFLQRHAADVHGRTLEIGDDHYTRLLGGARVATADVLHVDPKNSAATIIDDLASGDSIPSDAFDCVILTQTLHLIFDVPAAVRTVHRILKPGGVVLATVPGISQIDSGEWNSTWYYSFTPAAVQRLFAERFGSAQIEVSSYGNVLAACAFLQGLATEELTEAERNVQDPLYPMVVTVRAQKAAAAAP